MLFQDDCGGLQVEHPRRAGEFVDVPPIPGTLVMNVGDLLMRWSNGTYAGHCTSLSFSRSITPLPSYVSPFAPDFGTDPQSLTLPDCYPGIMNIRTVTSLLSCPA